MRLGMNITREEYERRKTEYWAAECRKAEVKPNGMAGSWSFRLKKDQEFDELLKQQGTEVQS
jgi:hypothetical protein